MKFNLSEEQILVRDAAREFAQTELLPGVIERDELQKFPRCVWGHILGGNLTLLTWASK